MPGNIIMVKINGEWVDLTWTERYGGNQNAQ